ncbi:MAG: hypothetical protein PHU98_06425 [Mariniphaga sp.]|nr:hypothetical protein [Mariniphaga sp.]
MYGEGLTGMIEGLVYPSWQQVSSVPEGASLLGYGLDFGYTNDPTALIAIYKYQGEIYLQELIYQTGLLSSDIIRLMKQLKVSINRPIIADSADPRTIRELQLGGFNVRGVKKEHIYESIDFSKKYLKYVTKDSTNLIKELRNYMWLQKDGKFINEPIDAYNHCFDGDTKIITKNGIKKIKDIKIPELILTRNGYKKLLASFVSGYGKILFYKIYFSNFVITIKCTSNHKFFINGQWKEINLLRANDLLCLAKFTMEKNTDYTTERDIFPEELKDYIGLYGNQKTGKYQKDMEYTILMKIRQIIKSKIWSAFRIPYILYFMAKTGLKNTLNFLLNFKERAYWRLQNGTPQTQVLNGIVNKRKNIILDTLHTVKEFVKFVGINLLQNTWNKDFVQINVNQDTVENQELITKKKYVNIAVKNMLPTDTIKRDIVANYVVLKVEIIGEKQDYLYDLTIDNDHEFFANGILVHNSLDAFRYATMGLFSRKPIQYI